MLVDGHLVGVREEAAQGWFHLAILDVAHPAFSVGRPFEAAVVYGCCEAARSMTRRTSASSAFS